MNKFLVASVVLAAGVGGYYYSQQGDTVADNEMLNYIPADTAIFSGQFTPFPYKDYLTATAGNYQTVDASAYEGMDELSEPQARFFMSLMKQYTLTMANPEDMLKLYGLPDAGRSFVYSLGLLPVMKLEIKDVQAFWQELDRAEAESGFKHTLKQHEGIDYRAYTLVAESETEYVDLVFAEHQGWLTVTLNTSLNQPKLLSQALGLATVENPIADTSMIADLMKKYNFTKDGISFLNHEEIIKGITTNDGNLIAKHLAKIAQLQGRDELAPLKSATCSSELQAIASNWPKTVMGLDKLDMSADRVELNSKVIIESNNQVILSALQKMRGFIPSTLANASVMSLGLGIDVNQLAPALSEIWNDLQTPSYQCEILAQSQRELQQQNPMMIGMMTGMVNGLKGISVSINGYKLSEEYGQPTLGEVDALVTVSADNPMMLLDMVKPFYPPLANIQLTADSDPVDVSSLLMLPPELDVRAKLAIKGQHLVLFSGEKAEAMANDIAKESLEANGLISLTMDYAKALTPLIEVIEQSGEPMPEGLDMMKGYDMKIDTGIDVTANGIEFDVGIVNQAPAK